MVNGALYGTLRGAWVDALAARPRQKSKRRRGAGSGQFRYFESEAGWIRYYDSGGNKPPLMTAPDGPCAIEHYAELIRDLSGQFRVICLDMPGNGFSFPAIGYGFGLEQTSNMLLELLDHLQVDRTILAFTCANSLFAINLVQRFPQRVTHLVLAQIPSLAGMLDWKRYNIPRPLTVPVLGQCLGKLWKYKLASGWFSLALPRQSEFKPDLRQQALAVLQGGGCFCLSSLVQAASHYREAQLLGVECPVLMVYGDQDYSHRHSRFESLRETIPQARLIAYPGCGHFPNLERREDYVRDLKGFVMEY